MLGHASSVLGEWWWRDAAYTIALRTSSRGMTPSFSVGKSSFTSAKSWKTSLISFSSSAVMSFSFASLERVRLGAAAVEELAGAPRLLGGWLGRMSVGVLCLFSEIQWMDIP